MTAIYDIEAMQSNIESQFSRLFEYVDESIDTAELHEVEKFLFQKLQNIGLSMIEYFLACTGTGYEPGHPPVSDDGKPLEYKGPVKSPYFSIFGELTIERARFRTEEGHYYYPLDARLNLPEKKYSYLLQKWLEAGAVETNYQTAVERLNEIFDFCLFPSMPQRVGLEVSQHVTAFYEQLPPPDPASEGSHLAVSADGKGVRMLKSERAAAGQTEDAPKARLGKGEKRGTKKQATVTADFSFDPVARTPHEVVQSLLNVPRSQEEKELQTAHNQARAGKNKHLSATLTGKEEAMDALIHRLKKRDPGGTKPIVALLDGDPSLRRTLEKALDKYKMRPRVDAIILDIIHVAEYIWEVATALHGERNDARLSWVHEKLLAILESKVGRVIGGFKQMLTKKSTTAAQKRVLKKAVTYFENHRDMMDYKTYLEKGYPVATGVVEGACNSLVKNRMEQSGMRWSFRGATSILKQRAVRLNGDWNAFWEYYMQSKQDALYPDSYKLAA